SLSGATPDVLLKMAGAGLFIFLFNLLRDWIDAARGRLPALPGVPGGISQLSELVAVRRGLERITPPTLIGLGLACAVGAGFFGLASGLP
ncbi:hypothetical protein, partial [Escherichia coli]|uniref:hypothetical protein n=1 Tax=Escherichia coli TaxID=562 RepID=UPI00215A3170